LKVALRKGQDQPGLRLSVLDEPVVFEVDGRLRAKRLQLASLIEGLSAVAVTAPPVPRPVTAQAGGEGLVQQGGAGINSLAFARTAFDTAVLDHLSGKISLRAERFDFGNGLMSRDAELTVTMTGERKARFKLDSGTTAGGRMTVTGELKSAVVGLETRGEFSLQGLDLASFTDRTGDRFAAGKLAMRTSFEGQGLSALSLVQALRGSGRASLEDLVVLGLSPKRIGQVPDGLLTGPAEIPEGALAAALPVAVGEGELRVGNRSLELSLRDGVMQVEQFAIQAPGGTTRAEITVDLASLAAESRWEVAAASQVEETPAWPEVRVIANGSLASLGSWGRRVNYDGLSRELSVRKMEWNVRELERLRREDEERARKARERAAELEKQRLEEEARTRAEAERSRVRAGEGQAAGGSGSEANATPGRDRQARPGGVVSEPLAPIDAAEQIRIEAEREAELQRALEARRRAAARLRARRERERREQEAWSPFGSNF
jgi:hypothetical protein